MNQLTVERLETRHLPAPLHSHVSIAVLDYATLVDRPEVEATVAAVQVQVSRDLKRFWHKDATFRFISDWSELRPHEYAVLVLDDIDEGGDALAWHEYAGGHPVSFVPIARELALKIYNIDIPWSQALSHEVLEMLCDPNTYNIKGYYEHDIYGSKEAFVFREVCDPFELNTYQINGVTVSDFALPRFYDQQARGRVDFLGAGHKPLHGSSGGFLEFVDVTTGDIVEIDF